MSDALMLGDSIKLAERKYAAQSAPIFMYRMDFPSPAFGGRLGSPHCMEIPFAFRNLAFSEPMIGAGPEIEHLSGLMSGAWVQFARTGDPSRPDLVWAAYTRDNRATMIFDRASGVKQDPARRIREFWTS